MGSPRRVTHSPGRFIVAGFAAAVVVGTVLLVLPVARAGEGGAPLMVALFTATSSVCVTGLGVVDTASYWSGFGQAVIVVLVQLGGLGIMSAASLLGLLVSRRIGLRNRLTTAAESSQLGIGDLGRVLRNVALVSLSIELVVAVALGARFRFGYDESVAHASWLGLFHAVMAFNNAGFALYPDSLVRFVTDGWICIPVALAVIAGSLGFPVLFELRKALPRPRRWSLHTKITVSATAVLLVLGTLMFLAVEWDNPATLGPLDPGGKLVASFFQGAMPRSAGFNSLNFADMKDSTLLGTDALMFVGGGAAGTAGGIKVTTFVLLLAVIVAEVRGDRDVTLFRRRIDHRTQRQALAVALMSLMVVVVSTFVLELLSDLPTSVLLFEVTSAFTTTGLSAGATSELSTAGHALLTALMFLGRLGPITFVSALALRDRPTLYTYPEGRPIIG